MGTDYPLKKLGDVADFVRGITFKPDDVIDIDTANAVACMRTKNVQIDLDLSDVWGVPASFVKRNEQYLREGDILVSSANSWNLVGKCSWVPKLPYRATIGGFISCLRRTSQNLDEKYLFHWFSSGPVQALVRNCARKTTNISNLSFEQCLALEIPLPPLEEQKRIAAILDQADDIRRKRQHAIERLNQLGQAIFHEMFGDPAIGVGVPPSVPIGSLVEKVSSWNPPRDAPDEKLSYIDLSSVDNKLKAVTANQVVLGCEAPSRARQRVLAGDILASTVRPNLNGVARVPHHLDGGTASTGFCVLRPKLTKLDPSYLFHWVTSDAFIDDMVRKATGASYPAVSDKIIFNSEIPLPPLQEQKLFAGRVQEIDELLVRMSEVLAANDGLFASLQHRAFAGEL